MFPNGGSKMSLQSTTIRILEWINWIWRVHQSWVWISGSVPKKTLRIFCWQNNFFVSSSKSDTFFELWNKLRQILDKFSFVLQPAKTKVQASKGLTVRTQDGAVIQINELGFAQNLEIQRTNQRRGVGGKLLGVVVAFEARAQSKP